MSSSTVVRPEAPRRQPSAVPAAARRVGWVFAIAANAVMLWIAHQLLEWEWPGFLTADFELLLPILTASFVAGMVVNASFMAADRGRWRALGDLVNAAFGLAVSIRAWDVFPVDFSGYDSDWSWVFRTMLVIAIAGTGVAIVVNTVRMAWPQVFGSSE